MTIRELREDLIGRLTTSYEEREARNILNWLLEEYTGKKHWDFTRTESSADLIEKISLAIRRLQQGEPVQHILGEVPFSDLRLRVSPDVLIPRPETEELVHWIRTTYQGKDLPDRVLDVGTGSGCIILSLAQLGLGREFWGWECSKKALRVAQQNAKRHDLNINWVEDDFLRPQKTAGLPPFDLVVSNPPYIPEREGTQLSPSVRDFEPAQALFVPDDQPLIFYERLAFWAQEGGIVPGGRLFVEVHEQYARAVAESWEKSGLRKVRLKADLQQKLRFAQAFI